MKFPVSHNRRRVRIPVRGAVRTEPTKPLANRDRLPRKKKEK